MEQLRTFVAIELPAGFKESLADVQNRLKAGSRASAKWVDPGSIHLTLKFLGDVSPGMVGSIGAALEEAARGIAPFRLEAKGLGAFPNLQGVQVVWMGIGGDTAALGRLQQRVETGLKPLGFKTETRPFKAHLTLARIRDYAGAAEREGLGQLIAATSFDTRYIDVTSIHLMRSQLTRDGAIYSRLATAALA